jgi:hypothetical protein
MEVVVDERVHGPRRFSGGVIAGEGDCRDDYACWFDEEVLCRLGPGIRWQAEDAYSKGVEEGHDDEAQTSENKEEAEMTTGLGTRNRSRVEGEGHSDLAGIPSPQRCRFERIDNGRLHCGNVAGRGARSDR